MSKKLYSLAFLIFYFSSVALISGQEKKVYELIYQDVQLLRQKIIQLENKIEQNQTDIQTMKDYLAEILKLIQLITREQAELGSEQRKVPAQYRLLLEKLDGMSDQFSRMSEDLMVLKSAVFPDEKQESGVTTEGVTPPEEETKESNLTQAEEGELFPIAPDLSPREVYDMAYSDFRKGNFLLAIEGFSIYLEQFSDSPLADNAKYWIGECYFSQEKYSDAVDHFNELFINFPQSDTLPAAYLKKGLSLLELDRKEEALSVFKLLVTKYPLEDEARIAQEK
ncbi:MAG: tol-pal system protein YbgF, partial [Candidatus Aminicenantes bacterium]|nr:tol-pal system protein YbgF [Candidatus Aminicenantes bacterium]